MQVTILVIETAEDFAARTDPAKQAAYRGAYRAYADALREAGVIVGGAALLPSPTAVTLRRRGGEAQVLDGPYAETKEQLGGYFTLEVPDMETALKWAARCPSAETGAVEVRPNLPQMEG